MSAYITTAQAAKLLNTTDRTIRRRLSVMSAKCPHLVRYVRKDGKTLLIDQRLVMGNFERLADPFPELISSQPPPEQMPPGTDTTAGELLQILKDQISEKDKQINSLQSHISELTERNREQNILIGRMQAEREKILIETAKEQTPQAEPETTTERPPQKIAIPTGQWYLITLLLLILFVVVLILLNSF